MKRIKFACLEKTIHFQLKEDLPHESAVVALQKEIQFYKDSLDRNRTKYKIVEEISQPDDSVMMNIKLQYNNTPVGDYLD